MRKLYLAIPAVALAVLGRFLGNDTLAFVAGAIGVVPLAGLMGQATEELAAHAGPKIGGFLNATLGNTAELIIGIFLILAGEAEVVKASLAGSIIGNTLLVLGLAFLAGGLRNGEQEFDAKTAGLHSTSLLLAVVGLMMPALFHQAVPEAKFVQDEIVSLGVGGTLMIAYILVVVFSFRTRTEPLVTHPAGESGWSKEKAIRVLIVATVLVAIAGELLAHSLESASETLGLSKVFVGLILVPLVGNAAEHGSAILLAAKNKVDIAIEIAAGSGAQIALFVAPLLVFLSLAVGKPMDFYFSGFEIAAVGFSTAIVTFISLDGKSNWLEGVQLVAAYAIMALSFFFLPGS